MNETAITTDEEQDLAPSRAEAAKPLWQTGDENQKILMASYIVLGLLVWYVLGHFLHFTVGFLFDHVFTDSSLALTLERSPVSVEYVLAGIITAAAIVFLNQNERAHTFGLEVVAEMKKVTWSPMDITWKSTFAVMVTVSICAVILGGFDAIWTALARWLLK